MFRFVSRPAVNSYFIFVHIFLDVFQAFFALKVTGNPQFMTTEEIDQKLVL